MVAVTMRAYLCFLPTAQRNQSYLSTPQLVNTTVPIVERWSWQDYRIQISASDVLIENILGLTYEFTLASLP